MKERLKKKSGFTLGELLVVVAIIGILVAVSIPVYTAQTKKAVIATNKANIRSARGAAATEFYTNPDITQVHEAKVMAVYFVYDVKEARVESWRILQDDKYDSILYECPTDEKEKEEYQSAWNKVKPASNSFNDWGRAMSKYASENHVCDKIFVFIGGPKDNSVGLKNGVYPYAIQTAPYYIDNKIGYNGGAKANPFGPNGKR